MLAQRVEYYTWGPVRDRGVSSREGRLDPSSPLDNSRSLTPVESERRNDMSTTEALGTQLDALQTQFYEVQAENRRLREANPEHAQLLVVEDKLTQTREENVRLAQQIHELSQDRPRRRDGFERN